MTDAIAKSEWSRPLSLFESFAASASVTLWLTAELEGPVDFAKLHEAWGLLRQAHPALTGRLVHRAAETPSGMPVFDLVVPATPDKPEIKARESIGEKLAHTVAQDRELAFVEVVLQDGQTLVSFAIHHGIADGRLGYHYFSLLWSYYTDLVEGKTPVAAPHPVPETPEALLAEHGIEKLDCWTDRAKRATATELPQPEHLDLVRERIRLSREATAKLRSMARARSLTVHGLLIGAIAVVARRWLQTEGDDAVDFAVVSPVDIRQRLNPPVPAWGGTNVLGNSTAIVATRPDSDPIDVGAQLLAQLDEDLKTGNIYQGFLHCLDSLGASQPKIPQAGTTNMGLLEPIRTPAEVSVNDVRTWLETDWAPIAAAMQTAGESDREHGWNRTYIMNTYDGRLSIEIGVQLAPEQARAHARDLEAILLEIADKT